MKPIVPFIVFIVLGLVLTGCESLPFLSTPTPEFEGTLLPFETIVMEKDGWAQNEKGPEVYLLKASEDIAQVESLLRPEHLLLLQQVDFDSYAVVALLRGGGVCAGVSGAMIDRLILHEKTLTVQTTFSDPAPDRACAHDFSMPYHLVQVSKEDVSTQGIDIILEIQKMLLR